MNTVSINEAVKVAAKCFELCVRKELDALIIARKPSKSSSSSSLSSSSSSSSSSSLSSSSSRKQSGKAIAKANKKTPPLIRQGKCKDGFFEHPITGKCNKRGSWKEKQLLRSASSNARHELKSIKQKERRQNGQKGSTSDAGIRSNIAAALGIPLNQVGATKTGQSDRISTSKGSKSSSPNVKSSRIGLEELIAKIEKGSSFTSLTNDIEYYLQPIGINIDKPSAYDKKVIAANEAFADYIYVSGSGRGSLSDVRKIVVAGLKASKHKTENDPKEWMNKEIDKRVNKILDKE